MCIRSYVLALAAGVCLMAATAQAQQTAQPAGGTAQAAAASQRRQVPIAVIDLNYILKNHPTMKQEIERIKSQAETVGAEFEKKRQSILKLMEELRENYTEGTPDYLRKEQEIAEMDTQFRLDVVRKNKEFDEARAQIFYQVHGQVSFHVKYFCENTGTFVVLKFSREKPDPKKPETIEMAMQQDVFWHQASGDVDITDWVIGRLKADAASATAQGQVNSAARPAAGAGQLK